jgi:hypothetical protein
VNIINEFEIIEKYLLPKFEYLKERNKEYEFLIIKYLNVQSLDKKFIDTLLKYSFLPYEDVDNNFLGYYKFEIKKFKNPEIKVLKKIFKNSNFIELEFYKKFDGFFKNYFSLDYDFNFDYIMNYLNSDYINFESSMSLLDYLNIDDHYLFLTNSFDINLDLKFIPIYIFNDNFKGFENINNEIINNDELKEIEIFENMDNYKNKNIESINNILKYEYLNIFANNSFICYKRLNKNLENILFKNKVYKIENYSNNILNQVDYLKKKYDHLTNLFKNDEKMMIKLNIKYSNIFDDIYYFIKNNNLIIDFEFIFNGEIFVKKKNISKFDLVIEFYLFNVNYYLKKFDFLENIQIQNYFSNEKLINVLNKLSIDDSISVDKKIFYSKIIVQKLEMNKYQDIENIMIPNSLGEFFHLKHFIYVDDSIKFEKFKMYFNQFQLLNDEFFDFITYLKIDIFTEKMKNEHNEEFEFDGVKQEITLSLKKYIEDYPVTDSIVFKEMLQNSDDSNANEISFVLDFSSYDGDKLVYQKLNEYNGPSIFIINNSVFLNKDIENIKNLSNSKKIMEIGKSGRFGVGFSSVYNFTDIPMIISNDNFIILDPHERNLI